MTALILGFILFPNVVLGQLLGTDAFFGLPLRPAGALRSSLALAAALPAASLAFWAVQRLVLAPLGLEELRLPALCLVLAILVLLPFRGWAARLLPNALLNCAVLGVGLAVSGTGAGASLAAGLSAGAGWLLAAVVFTSLRERLALEWAPRAMRGLPLDLVSAGLMSLAFLGFERTLLAALIR
jgi:electron transport complex protein RnfA